MKNVHERIVQGTPREVWELVETLSTPNDRLWPGDPWPRMKLDKGLTVGSRGGHDTVRYHVEHIDPGRSVVFRFEPPTGLDGTHEFEVMAAGSDTKIRHTISAEPTGTMHVAWPLMVRWLHDALIEDGFDTAEAALSGEPTRGRRHSTYVGQLIRALVPHRPDGIGVRAGTGAAVSLAGIAALHLAWAFGSTFPAADARSLARTVVGGNTFPSSGASATVAGLLGIASALVAARAHPASSFGRRLPTVLTRPAVIGVAFILGLRGVGGLISGALGLPKTTSTFRLLDLVLYSPLCLSLGAAILRMERDPDRR